MEWVPAASRPVDTARYKVRFDDVIDSSKKCWQKCLLAVVMDRDRTGYTPPYRGCWSVLFAHPDNIDMEYNLIEDMTLIRSQQLTFLPQRRVLFVTPGNIEPVETWIQCRLSWRRPVYMHVSIFARVRDVRDYIILQTGSVASDTL